MISASVAQATGYHGGGGLELHGSIDWLLAGDHGSVICRNQLSTQSLIGSALASPSLSASIKFAVSRYTARQIDTVLSAASQIVAYAYVDGIALILHYIMKNEEIWNLQHQCITSLGIQSCIDNNLAGSQVSQEIHVYYDIQISITSGYPYCP